MKHIQYKFSHSSTDYFLDGSFSQLKKITNQKTTVLITDENVHNAHKTKFKGWNTILLKPGEEYKVQESVDAVIEHLITLQADRTTTLVGVGGGVITDITGFIASVYMRGLRFGFVPSSLLAMVDASIGGKNGVDVGIYKNIVGTIRQPAFLLYDLDLLSTLPQAEWENGFAEIIKHACIRDEAMFKFLEKNSLGVYKAKKNALKELVHRNVLIKSGIVKRDEFEKGERRLLNFGHTLGHALEKQYELSHGQAISIGMTYASRISARVTGFKDTARVVGLIENYGLPADAYFNQQKLFNALIMDKKREGNELNYVLLQKIGKGVIKSIALKELQKIIQAI